MVFFNKLFSIGNKSQWKLVVFGKTIYQKILRIYFLTILLGAMLLSFSFSTHKSINFFDSFFIAVSAFTNTGLTSHTVSETFSFTGKLIVLILIQMGGMGFMTLIIYFWSLLSRKGSINVEQRLFLHFERGSYKKVESLPTVKIGIFVLLISEIIGALILFLFFLIAQPLTCNQSTSIQHKGSFLKSLWLAIFHAVSSANNAGFDILGKYSIIPYRNDENNILSVILLFESIIGGIGYPIFYDVYMYFKNRKQGKDWPISLFSKIALLTYSLLAVSGAIMAVGFEFHSGILKSTSTSSSNGFGWGRNQTANKIWNVIYLTLSSRSSGFYSIETSCLSESTKWLLSVLMFIGASPASTGGGIRTITIFIILARMFYTSMGRKHLTVFYKTIDQKLVLESCNVFVLSIILLSISIFVLIVSKSDQKMGDAIFEASSAFGTAGLTSGLTSSSNFLGKGALIVLMFVGQLGVSNALLSITTRQPKSKNLRYCSESLRIT